MRTLYFSVYKWPTAFHFAYSVNRSKSSSVFLRSTSSSVTWIGHPWRGRSGSRLSLPSWKLFICCVRLMKSLCTVPWVISQPHTHAHRLVWLLWGYMRDHDSVRSFFVVLILMRACLFWVFFFLLRTFLQSDADVANSQFFKVCFSVQDNFFSDYSINSCPSRIINLL